MVSTSTSTASADASSGVTCHSVSTKPQIATKTKALKSSSRCTMAARKVLNPMLRHLSIERRSAEPELTGGSAQVAFVLRDRLANGACFEVLEVEIRGVGRCRLLLEEEIVGAERLAFRHDDGALDGVHELADVARPVVLLQLESGIGRDRKPGFAVLPAEARRVVLEQ